MRSWLALLALATTGCLAPDGCILAGDEGIVTAVHGNTLYVELTDGSPVVLLAQPTVLADTGGDCSSILAASVQVGDTVVFQADRWTQSDPPQARPTSLVVVRR